MTTQEPSPASLVTGPAASSGLAETFVMLADTLVDDYDVVDLLDQLVMACIDLLDVAAAGLLLNDQQRQPRGRRVLERGDPAARDLPAAEQRRPVPGLCARRRAVISADLDLDGRAGPASFAVARLPGSAPSSPLPLRLRDQTIGGLNLFDNRVDPISTEERRLAQALADVATIGILQRRSSHRSTMVAEQLQYALNSRVLIEQAKGVLAERNGVSMDVAFIALRRHARNHNFKLTDVAEGVVRGDIGPATITVTPPDA